MRYDAIRRDALAFQGVGYSGYSGWLIARARISEKKLIGAILSAGAQPITAITRPGLGVGLAVRVVTAQLRRPPIR